MLDHNDIRQQYHHEKCSHGWQAHLVQDRGLSDLHCRSWALEKRVCQSLSDISEHRIMANAEKTRTIDGCGQGVKEKTLLLQTQEAFMKAF